MMIKGGSISKLKIDGDFFFLTTVWEKRTFDKSMTKKFVSESL